MYTLKQHKITICLLFHCWHIPPCSRIWSLMGKYINKIFLDLISSQNVTKRNFVYTVFKEELLIRNIIERSFILWVLDWVTLFSLADSKIIKNLTKIHLIVNLLLLMLQISWMSFSTSLYQLLTNNILLI